MASVSTPKDNSPKAEQPPLTFIEHEQAVGRACAALTLAVRRAEEAGHGLVIQMMSGSRQRGWSFALERDSLTPHPAGQEVGT